jgi:hypothetical protein
MTHLDRKLELLCKKLSSYRGDYTIHCCYNPLGWWNPSMDKPTSFFCEAGRKSLTTKIDKIIMEASVEEALTSKYYYVRKAKEYFLKFPNKKKVRKLKELVKV